ncbi:hypothetical protein SH601_14130 [Gracilibacillus sp. S3-1-1]|uniref:Uncharacterized protein n=1 Tax=Gracilibacillus pellucidus TaxID=3095368 RepID=A0ACC6M8D1_9BACI|nr:O-antigen ligase family protein [Gracilibacillus sp. S3-1-1]MDX8047126.1 hypothetical protein [Gracilibacillus sp. S3-1-1]
MRKIKNLFCIIFLSGIFLSGSIQMIDDWSAYTDIVLALSCLGLLYIYIVSNKLKLKIPIILTIIFMFYLLMTVMSALVNSNLQMFLSFGRYLLVFITLCVIVPNLMKEETYRFTLISVFVSQIPLLVFSFAEESPFSNLTRVYMGVFYNSNSFGGVVATLFVSILAWYFSTLGKKKYVVQIFLLIGLSFTFLLTIFSGSRTSTLAIIIITFISTILYAYKKGILNNISIKAMGRFLVGIIVASILIFVFYRSDYYSVFDERIIEKFVRKANSGDVLDERGGIISKTIDEAAVFGHGPDYFSDKFGLGAHNSFISILGQFGVLAIVLFLIIWVYILIISLKHFMKSNNYLSIFPLLIILFFIITSFTEIMLMKVSMLAALILGGAIRLEKTFLSKHIQEKDSF